MAVSTALVAHMVLIPAPYEQSILPSVCQDFLAARRQYPTVVRCSVIGGGYRCIHNGALHCSPSGVRLATQQSTTKCKGGSLEMEEYIFTSLLYAHLK